MKRKKTTTARTHSLKSAAPAADPVTATVTQPRRLLDTLTSEQRKRYPITSGFLDYFPDAIADASNISWGGNEKHNPGQPLHWSRGKSADHADCISRHLEQRGGFDVIEIDGKQYRFRHSAALLWRAAALLQEELEAELGLSPPRGAKDPV